MTADGAPRRLGKQPALDGIRGVAILLVMVCHARLLEGGALGVDVFFVLSGFLITTLLVEEWHDTGAVSFRRFYLRRALRLLPGLYLLVAIIWIFTHVVLTGLARTMPLSQTLATLFYVFNWLELAQMQPSAVFHCWSLAIEEQFYFVWPVVLVGLLQRGTRVRTILGGLAATVIASALLRALLVSPDHMDTIYRCYLGSDTRADALLIGCALAFLVREGRMPRSVGACSVIAVVSTTLLVALVVSSTPFSPELGKTSIWLYRGGYTVAALAAAGLIIAALGAPTSLFARMLRWRPLIWFGHLSYSLYLFHAPLFELVLLLTRRSALFLPIKLVIMFGISIAVSCLSYYGVERPFLRLKDRYGRPASPA